MTYAFPTHSSTPIRSHVVYMLTTDATNYYKNMTEQNARMPVLISQVI